MLKQKPKTIAFLLFILTLALAVSDLELCETDDSAGTCTACVPYADASTGYCKCLSGYYMVPDAGSGWCDRCHTSCDTCFGPLYTNCLTCSQYFQFNSQQSTCQYFIYPYFTNATTLGYGYNFYGFSIMDGWSVNNAIPTKTSYCGSRSLLGGVSIISGPNQIISQTFNIPYYHYQVRIKVAFYVHNFNGSSVGAKIDVDGTTHTHTLTYKAQSSCNGYPYIHTNIQDDFTHTGSTAVVTFSVNTTHQYGIRQFYIISKLCAQANCSACDGPNADQCTACVDGNRSPISKVCKCTYPYFQQPYAGTCVKPCPSVPIKYYGHNTTYSCVTKCDANTYANDDVYQCWSDCPVTSTITTKKLFKDKRNWKCVSNCPDTEPYAFDQTATEGDRICYATCPANTYAVNATVRYCVAKCPNNGNYQLWGFQGQCIPYCPDQYWADPVTLTCVQTCSNTVKFRDSSRGYNLCVATCPSPNYFGDTNTNYCVETCPATYFGQNTQLCVLKCGGARWGLNEGNRMCIDKCPSGQWGQPTKRICVKVPTQCTTNATVKLFGNNFTRTCVLASQCPQGTFGDNTTKACVTYCPSGTYGHPTTRYCQTQCCSTGCSPALFKDSGVNLCVSTCITQDTYADIYSGYKCVTSCNSTGSTPWADSSTKTCVNDCNQTVAGFISDNTTWSCVYYCPSNYYLDNTTLAPACVQVCPNGYYASNQTGTGLCVLKCSTYPPKFGDNHTNINLCVDVCTMGTYGDQTGNRHCVATCPTNYFAQNDTQRRCVKKCKDLTYGYNNFCYTDPHSCPTNYFGDDSTNLCVLPCPVSEGTFGDPLSKLCVRSCPDNPAATGPRTYYADTTNRQCVLRCSQTSNFFGNNNTRTCVTTCLDVNSYAQADTAQRVCVARCLEVPTFHYANNFTRVCGTSINCQANYYGDNGTQLCVQYCPTGSFAFQNTTVKICIDVCPSPYHGDITTGKKICVINCPSQPERFAYIPDRLCIETCPSTYYGQQESTVRTCTQLCPSGTFSYQPTRRCVKKCPNGYFADDTPTVRKCHSQSSDCTYGFGDPYLNKCVNICSGPTPVDLFGLGDDCVSFCTTGYADSITTDSSSNILRLCVPTCPIGYFGDPTTRSCVSQCITLDTWADDQTRKCESTCAALPIATYSQDYSMTCVTSSNCPITPQMTFGDNNTRSCVSNCTLSKFGDPVSRFCVTQCPNTTEPYYGDISTGQYLCILVCPSVPRLFGYNATNLCVSQCTAPTYGDQTGKRSCLNQCPIVGGKNYYAQNTSRICVLVCQQGTWGLQSTRQCVQSPTDCGSLWALDNTNMCVTTCPAIYNVYGDPSTQKCVSICPDGTNADDKTRTCVAKCPEDYGLHGTFGNNDTNICQQYCQQPGAYGDAQTINRYCVTECSQTPSRSFADPSTKRCVPQCPAHPNYFGETENFTCITTCPSPYYADTNSRLCVSTCPTSYFKVTSPSNLCVKYCPSNPQLFADSLTGLCSATCSSNQFRYTTDRTCVSSCQSLGLLQYQFTCVKFCPDGYYANSTGNCLSSCPANTYGENTTTTCQSTCVTGFAQGSLCVAKCSDGKYGQNKICKTTCTSPATASNATNLCVSSCVAGQFMENGVCLSQCAISTNYADPITRKCTSSCTLNRYSDPSTNKCVQFCPVNSYRDPSYTCKTNCNPLRADNATWSCTSKCSDGLWGHNYLCISVCPSTFYGYITDRDCYTIANRPAVNLYADDTTQTWVTDCPMQPDQFRDPNSKKCVSNCTTTNYYADPQSRNCQTDCTNNSYYRDDTTKRCVLVCPSGYYANPTTHDCQSHCTNGLYDYILDRKCVSNCLAPYYAYTNYTCTLGCPSGSYTNGGVCSSSCPTNQYADSTTNRCVKQCIGQFASDTSGKCQSSCSLYSELADNSTNKCVPLCPTVPDYYAQNFVCVLNCSIGLYADPTTNVRQCKSTCTQGLYGDPMSRRCLVSCPPGYWAQNSTNMCVQQCLSGFADNQTGVCMDICPSPTFADSKNKKCMSICTENQYGQGNVCVAKCSGTTYGNPLTRKCQSGCPGFDYLFAENTTRNCVKNCSITANSYADRNLRICVSNCSLANQYALDGQAICTSLCPEGLFMQNSTKKCVPTCLTGFAESTTRYCVLRCFGSPQTFGHVTDKVCKYKCLTLTDNLYADNSTNMCVSTCPDTESFFSDPLSGNCVLFCPQGYYAENGTRTCTPVCTIGYADNLTRKCVIKCPATEQTFGTLDHKCVRQCPTGMFAENVSQLCVNYNECPLNTWSDITSKYCVSRCPSQPLYFGLNSSTSCVTQCPQVDNLFGDYVTQTCILTCYSVNGKQRFADPISRTCVYRCPIQHNLYGDSSTSRCVQTCPGNGYRDNSTQMCVSLCPSNPDYYGDNSTYNCVRTCPVNRFASQSTKRVCISNCQAFLTFGDETTWRCTPKCPIPYFASNHTYMCVLSCPSNPDYFADPHSRTCVLNCPSGANWITFADQSTRTCVTQCPSGTYAQNSSQRCVSQCPNNQFADTVIRVCVQDCTVRPWNYKETNNRVCVQQCPTIPIKAYKYNLNNSCVYNVGTLTGCPNAYYANPLNNECTTLCPHGYFAQDSTKSCVEACQTGEFADPVDRKCKTTCTSAPQYFRYSQTDTCLQHCPQPYFSDNSSYNCQKICPTSPRLFKYQNSRQCVKDCPAPFYSYNATGQCLLQCPQNYFAQDSTRSCQTGCLGQFFADDSTHKCVKICPQDPDYYGYNNDCIQDCPDNTYADYSTRLCVAQCPVIPLLFADNSTNRCVATCPVQQNFFADNITRKCVLNCSSGLFSEVNSRTCVQDCPEGGDTFANVDSRVCQNACISPYYKSKLTMDCVSLCPNQPIKTYALDNGRQCVQVCPVGLFGQNITRKCVTGCPTDLTAFADSTNHLCVTTCPSGYFAENTTFSCVSKCPQNSFADSTIRKCVQKCPGTQRLFADKSSWKCVIQCPQGSYGDQENWTCIPTCQDLDTFIFQVSNLCVYQCPKPYFGFIPTRTCVLNCGAGLYGQNVDRTCVNCPSQCPTCMGLQDCLTCQTNLYLQYGICVQNCTLTTSIANYANLKTMKCVQASSCPQGYFGNNETKSCSQTCPTKQYKNSTTKRCQKCPQYCTACTNSTHCSACQSDAQYSITDEYCYSHCSDTLKYYLEGQCVDSCINGTYLDYTGVSCQKCNQICATCYGSALNCTSCAESFLFQDKCITQCPANYYSLNGACLLCDQTVKSCSQPLTFQVASTVENYKQVVVVKFNQKTSVKSDPTKFMKVNLRLSRLLSVADLINNGVGFTAVVMPDGTIKLYLDVGVTLVNPIFDVVFTDSSQIQSQSGASLQMLQSQISMPQDQAQIFPPESTQPNSLSIAGTVLIAVFLALLLLMFIIGPVTLYLTIQAFQFIAFMPYTSKLPPNLFYFLRQLRLARLNFLPSMFAPLYQQPESYDQNIPQKIIDTDGQLSFGINGAGFIDLLFIYMILSIVVYLFTTKVNSNRPLKNFFINIWQTRIKFTIINDFLWITITNVLVCAFLQYKRPSAAGEVAIGTLSFIFYLACFLTFFIYGIYKWRTSPQSLESNFMYISMGCKQYQPAYFINFAFLIRKILFAVFLSASLKTSLAQCSLMILLFAVMLIYLLILRPFVEYSWNIAHIIHELFQISIWALLLNYATKTSQPASTKLLWGDIITYVIIAYLSLTIIWGIFRSYTYLKKLREITVESELYKLYADSQYGKSLEKQLTELQDQENGEIESINVTNVGDQEEQIVRLKIKRRKKKQPAGIKISQPLEIKPRKYKKGQYSKIEDGNSQDIIEKSHQQFQKIEFQQQAKDQELRKTKVLREDNWIKMESKEQSKNNSREKQNVFQGQYQQNINGLLEDDILSEPPISQLQLISEKPQEKIENDENISQLPQESYQFNKEAAPIKQLQQEQFNQSNHSQEQNNEEKQSQISSQKYQELQSENQDNLQNHQYKLPFEDLQQDFVEDKQQQPAEDKQQQPIEDKQQQPVEDKQQEQQPFDLLDELKLQESDENPYLKEKEQQPKQDINNHFDFDIEGLQSPKQDNQEQAQDKKKKKQMHLRLFEDDFE